ncbi:hypothetical protein [Pantoea stewartii]|uniref:hypothetical protein n=1 Tax=Pantoea stewartii TaxID=66269 RepID=UPI0025A0E103|nr:hypothetical protein [Pantoea stewartii]
MTTNSANRDVQALIADCERDIASIKQELSEYARYCRFPPDVKETISLLNSQLKRQQVALAALTAGPVAFTTAKMLSDVQDGIDCGFMYGVSLHAPIAIDANIPLYTNPPAQLLRPVDLSECKKLWYDHDDLSAEIVCIPIKEIKKALRQQGYDVKS